jgi:hypothetical protein
MRDVAAAMGTMEKGNFMVWARLSLQAKNQCSALKIAQYCEKWNPSVINSLVKVMEVFTSDT